MRVINRLPVLVVDAEKADLSAASSVLRSAGIANVVTLQDSRKVKGYIAANPCEAVLLDLEMSDGDGGELLDHITTTYPDLPVIVITGTNDVSVAVSCMRRGAYDYLVKPLDKEYLVSAVRRAIEIRELRRENQRLTEVVLNEDLQRPEAFSDILTVDRTMHAMFKYLEVIASTDQPVLITGETGTGKDLVAQALHQLSGRKGDFVAVNIAGFDDNMFADALFGHKKGAFTGAEEARAGLIVSSSEGTIFLDEIGDLSIASQVKLLRLVQEGEYFPLGADVPKNSTARVVVATSHDLTKQQLNGLFRKDLYYRLRTHHVHLPPLRERLEDLDLLLRHFIGSACSSLNRPVMEPTNEIVQLLEGYHFPGNIRELKAMVFDAVSRSRGNHLDLDALRRTIDQNQAAPIVGRISDEITFPRRLPTLKQVQDLLVGEAMRRADGNQATAASYLGITRQALNKRLHNTSGEIEAEASG